MIGLTCARAILRMKCAQEDPVYENPKKLERRTYGHERIIVHFRAKNQHPFRRRLEDRGSRSYGHKKDGADPVMFVYWRRTEGE